MTHRPSGWFRLAPIALALALWSGGDRHAVQAAPAAAPAAQGCTWYTVRPGEWVWQIARRTGDTAEGIIQRNGLVPPHALQPGQVLWICGGSGSGGGSVRVVGPVGVHIRAMPNVYAQILAANVPAGTVLTSTETHDDLHGVRWYRVLLPWSPPYAPWAQTGWAASRTWSGVTLLVPAGYSAAPWWPGQDPVVPGPVAPAPGVPATCLPRPASITVAYGDTLFKIARRYCTSVWAIQAANGIPNADYIAGGQRLYIP